jgi:phosphate transport system substrate-binding protein
MLAIASSLTFASGPNQIKGSVEGQPLNQAATPLEGIRLQALNSAGVERDACQSGHSGGFLLKLPSEDSLYRLIVWDEFNRWWGREISQLHNDGKHNDLGSIMLRPQTSGLSDAAERREQATIIGWVWKHNLLSAAMMELHLGAFDRPAQPSQVQVAGAGSTNSFPLQAAWSADYQGQHPDVSFNFQAIGSGGGIRQLAAGTTDFGSIDTALTDAQLSDSKHRLKQLPIALGGTVVVYSQKLPSDLRLSGPMLAKIYLGEIKTWNDKELSAINPGKELPNLPITPIHRADSSGSTVVLTNYLSDASTLWREVEGSSSQVAWKAGMAAKGNEGISGMVRNTEGAIGYVDFVFAASNNLRMAAIENASERFILPSPDSISAVAVGAGSESDLRDSLKKPLHPEAYPMSSATWMLIPISLGDPKKALILLDYVNFSLGQTKSKEIKLGYVPLPPSLEAATRRELNKIAASIVEQAGAVQGER